MKRVEVLRRLLWRKRVRVVHEWRDAERAEYAAAVARIVGQVPDGHGTVGRPRS